PYERVESGRIYRHYDEAPYALETRTPNVFLAAAATALLVAAVSALSGYWWLGALLGAAYATSPEILVRSSYGGYFSVGAFATIAILIAAYRSRRVALPLATGLFAALVDHKLVLLPAAIGLNACWRFMLGRTLTSFKALFNPQIIGFVLGTVA